MLRTVDREVADCRTEELSGHDDVFVGLFLVTGGNGKSRSSYRGVKVVCRV